MIVIMLIGWMGWANLPEDDAFDDRPSPIIQRITAQTVILDQHMEAGLFRYNWQAETLSPGLYFLKFEWEGQPIEHQSILKL